MAEVVFELLGNNNRVTSVHCSLVVRNAKAVTETPRPENLKTFRT